MITSIAQPGDRDLDCDVTGLTIASVVASDDQEILVHLVGGRGLLGAQPDIGNVDIEVRTHFPTLPRDMFAGYVAGLHRWRDDHIPVRMCAAPGRLTVLIAPDGELVPVPRRMHPDWAPLTEGTAS